MAADMSLRIGWISAGERERIDRLLNAAGLPTEPFTGLSPPKMLELMKVDKKVRHGRLRLVLLKGIGKAEIVTDYPAEALAQTVSHFTAPKERPKGRKPGKRL